MPACLEANLLYNSIIFFESRPLMPRLSFGMFSTPQHAYARPQHAAQCLFTKKPSRMRHDRGARTTKESGPAPSILKKNGSFLLLTSPEQCLYRTVPSARHSTPYHAHSTPSPMFCPFWAWRAGACHGVKKSKKKKTCSFKDTSSAGVLLCGICSSWPSTPLGLFSPQPAAFAGENG